MWDVFLFDCPYWRKVGTAPSDRLPGKARKVGPCWEVTYVGDDDLPRKELWCPGRKKWRTVDALEELRRKVRKEALYLIESRPALADELEKFRTESGAYTGEGLARLFELVVEGMHEMVSGPFAADKKTEIWAHYDVLTGGTTVVPFNGRPTEFGIYLSGTAERGKLRMRGASDASPIEGVITWQIVL